MMRRLLSLLTNNTGVPSRSLSRRLVDLSAELSASASAFVSPPPIIIHNSVPQCWRQTQETNSLTESFLFKEKNCLRPVLPSLLSLGSIVDRFFFLESMASMMTMALAAGDGCSRTVDLGVLGALTLVDKGELGLFDS